MKFISINLKTITCIINREIIIQRSYNRTHIAYALHDNQLNKKLICKYFKYIWLQLLWELENHIIDKFVENRFYR